MSGSDSESILQPEMAMWAQKRLYRHFRLSFRRVETVFELAEFAVVDNPRFVIGIAMTSVVVPEILEFPVRRPYCYFVVHQCCISLRTLLLSLLWLEALFFCYRIRIILTLKPFGHISQRECLSVSKWFTCLTSCLTTSGAPIWLLRLVPIL